ncbi:Hsp20/alpha crystallin family protein [Candidatus Babeliales bacterium]|nr:Hsp20/alpha crystallin family protein [Candidatus Babeliales bacterium]
MHSGDWEHEFEWAVPKWGEDHEKGLFRVEVPFPGYAEEDIKLAVNHHHDGTPFLEIKAECEEETEDTKPKEMHEAWYHGHTWAERHITLPHHIDTNSAQATFRNGIVMVTFKTNHNDKEHGKEIPLKK